MYDRSYSTKWLEISRFTVDSRLREVLRETDELVEKVDERTIIM